MAAQFRIEKLRRDHAIDAFDCGREELNRFLSRYAWQAQQGGASQSYVALTGDEVVGFHTLVVGHVDHGDAPDRLTKGMARHPVPLMILARLGVSTGYQGKGLGSGLLKDALTRTLQAADIAGIRAIAAHAKDEAARQFYQNFDFIPGLSDPNHMFLLLKDARRHLQG